MLCLRLPADTLLALGRESDAIGIARKYAPLIGKEVTVFGKCIGYQPLWGPPEAASIVMEVIEPVTDIRPL